MFRDFTIFNQRGVSARDAKGSPPSGRLRRLCAVALCAFSAGATASSPAWGQFRVVDLGALAPGDQSVAFTINDSGDVSGAILAPGSNFQAVVWSNATASPMLAKLGPPGQNSIAFSVNQPNVIVGEINPSGVEEATLFPDTPLDPTGKTVFSIAYNSDGLGIIVGVAGLASDPNPHAVLFNGGEPVTSSAIGAPFDLGNFGTDVSFAYDINGSRHVVGTAATASGPSHAFLHLGVSKLDQSTDDLGTLGGLQSEATCINNFDQVAGWSDLKSRSGKGIRHAFLWQNGKMRDLLTPFAKLPMMIKDPSGRNRLVTGVSTLERLVNTSDREGGECMNGRVIKGTPRPQIVGYSQLYYGAPAPSATCAPPATRASIGPSSSTGRCTTSTR